MSNIEVRKLYADSRSAILEHVSSQERDDAFTRFGFMASKESMVSYVDGINFNRDVVLGAFYRGLLIGMVHVSVFQHEGHPVGELGISVDAPFQGRGVGRRLFEMAVAASEKRHLVSLHVKYLRRNGKMASLCRRMKTTFDTDGEETSCRITVSVPHEWNSCRHEMQDGIEVFSKEVKNPRGHVLFVHGVAGDAWQWRENFMPEFARHGLSSTSFSLRGHGESEQKEGTTLRDYEEDLNAVLEGMGTKPNIIIGHSMGGFLVQRMMEREDCFEKAVLVSSVPPWGFLPDMLESVIDNMGDPLGKIIATQASQGKPAMVNPDNVSASVQVLGGSDDRLIPVDVVEATAKAYDTEAVIFAGVGHSIISGRRWKEASDLMIGHIA